MSGSAVAELYRQSKIGESLQETLNEMIESGIIDPKLAFAVVEEFDKVIAESLATRVRTKLTMKGHLDTYRFCDDVWTLTVDKAVLRFDAAEIQVPEIVQIIAVGAPKKDEKEAGGTSTKTE